MDWFTTLFSYSLSLPSALQVWDFVLGGGLMDVFYVTGLAILRLLADDLEVLSFTALMERFKPMVRALDPFDVRDARVF